MVVNNGAEGGGRVEGKKCPNKAHWADRGVGTAQMDHKTFGVGFGPGDSKVQRRHVPGECDVGPGGGGAVPLVVKYSDGLRQAK